MIRLAISHYEGHMSEVARRLGIGRSTLYRKLKDFGHRRARGSRSQRTGTTAAATTGVTPRADTPD